MIANFSRVRELAYIDELLFWRGQVREAARSFADLAERFRLAPSRCRSASILKHDINSLFAMQAGELLCHCWRRGMLAVYRPNFYLTEEGEARLRYVFSWFTFIRWHLAPIYKNRFRADWRSEFAPEMDHLRRQKVVYPADFTTQFSDNHSELLLWRLGLYAEVQATACAIFVEELQRLQEAIDQHRGQLPEEAARTGKRKQLGRKKADYETIQQETKLANKWNQARQSGTVKLDFAKDNQVELTALDAKYGKRRPTVTKMLDALLDRVARRKRKTTSNGTD